MKHANLAIYLNDHLAGSVAALEILTHLEASYAATPPRSASSAAASAQTARSLRR